MTPPDRPLTDAEIDAIEKENCASLRKIEGGILRLEQNTNRLVTEVRRLRRPLADRLTDNQIRSLAMKMAEPWRDTDALRVALREAETGGDDEFSHDRVSRET